MKASTTIRHTPLLLAGLALLAAACGTASNISAATSTTSAGGAGSGSTQPPAGSQPSAGAPQQSTTSATTATAAPATSTGRTAGCSTQALSLSLRGPNGAAGNMYYQFVFRNTAATPCELFGYPGVSFLDRSHDEIGQPASREPNVVERPVLLGPGGNAYAVLDVLDPGVIQCGAGSAAAWVRVYPPGNTESVLLDTSGRLQVCASGTTETPASLIAPVTATSQP